MTRYQFGAGTRARRCITQNGKNTRSAAPCQTMLEKEFPHVVMAIQAMWGYPELNAYFHKLTMNEREQRQGFPPEVWDDIYLPGSMHQPLVPGSLSTTASGISCA
jgi:hypothetical protein